MTNPTECKYCGCEEVMTATDSGIVFRCWSTYLTEDDYWNVSNNCGAKCAVRLVELRERIQRALKRLETATRFELVRDDHVAYMKGRDSWGNWLDVIEVEQAIEILKGKTDGQTE